MTDEEMFAVWYKLYPKKKAVGDARKAWGQVKKDRLPLQQMMEILKQQCQDDEWRKDDGKYIPYPATYLRRLQFLDELEVELPEKERDWESSWDGIVAKGKQFGITEDMFTHPQQFKRAVITKANDNVYRLKKSINA